jgi:hypothetical protein
VACLLYCIFREPYKSASVDMRGVRGSGVFVVAEAGLCGAASSYEPEVRIDIDELETYGNVIEQYHRRFSVIPMRFGCVFSDNDGIRSYLTKERARFIEILGQFEGHVEMGIRILDGGPESRGRSTAGASEAEDGRSFLFRRKAYYREKERLSAEMESVSGQLSGAFEGLYSKRKVEYRPGMLAMYFLVHETHLESFTGVFQEVKRTTPWKLLLSGPWPPYNFLDFESGAPWKR